MLREFTQEGKSFNLKKKSQAIQVLISFSKTVSWSPGGFVGSRFVCHMIHKGKLLLVLETNASGK